jgi:hypothetical protein
MASPELAMELADHASADAELGDGDGSAIVREQTIVTESQRPGGYIFLPRIETGNRGFQTASITSLMDYYSVPKIESSWEAC